MCIRDSFLGLVYFGAVIWSALEWLALVQCEAVAWEKCRFGPVYTAAMRAPCSWEVGWTFGPAHAPVVGAVYVSGIPLYVFRCAWVLD